MSDRVWPTRPHALKYLSTRKGKITMRWICVLVAAGMIASWVPRTLAQEGLSSEQLRRMYDDAVVQLKTAQDRRNELARENDKLRSRITQLETVEKELEKEMAAANARADKTFSARSERAAFQEFLAANPTIRIQWQTFMARGMPGMPGSRDLLGLDWPFPDKSSK
jgi:hypothetical protein